MGSIGNSKTDSMTYNTAEDLWTLARAKEGTEEYEQMNNVLSNYIDENPGYDGTMYRGVAVRGLPNSNDPSIVLDYLRKKFPLGKSISGAVNKNSREFVSWSSDMLQAYTYAGEKNSDVILVNDYGVQNGRMLKGTDTPLGMKEVLTRKNIKYQVNSFSYGKVPGTNEKAYFIHVSPLEKKRRSK